MLDNRLPPPLIALVFAGVIFIICGGLVDVFAPLRLIAICGLTVAGYFFCFSGWLAFRRANTSVNPLTPAIASSLVRSGIYRYSRNPMYVGFALLLAAWALCLQAIWGLIAVPLYMAYLQRFQIQPEERALNKLFGENFTEYSQQTRRWL